MASIEAAQSVWCCIHSAPQMSCVLKYDLHEQVVCERGMWYVLFPVATTWSFAHLPVMAVGCSNSKTCLFMDYNGMKPQALFITKIISPLLTGKLGIWPPFHGVDVCTLCYTLFSVRFTAHINYVGCELTSNIVLHIA